MSMVARMCHKLEWNQPLGFIWNRTPARPGQEFSLFACLTSQKAMALALGEVRQSGRLAREGPPPGGSINREPRTHSVEPSNCLVLS